MWMDERFIVGRDFNAKHTDWVARLTSTKRRELRKAIREAGCNCHSTGKLTYWPTDRNKEPDLLEFFTSIKISPNFMETEGTFDLNSDRSVVILTLSERIIKKEVRPMLVINKTSGWVGFRITLTKTSQILSKSRNN